MVSRPDTALRVPIAGGYSAQRRKAVKQAAAMVKLKAHRPKHYLYDQGGCGKHLEPIIGSKEQSEALIRYLLRDDGKMMIRASGTAISFDASCRI